MKGEGKIIETGKLMKRKRFGKRKVKKNCGYLRVLINLMVIWNTDFAE